MSWPVHAAFLLWNFALGAAVGSFLNVCIYRIPWEKSIVWPASRCPKCLGPIAARDNVPILGWLALRGACRRCGRPISVRYPLVEALVGLLFVAVYATDVLYGDRDPWGGVPVWLAARVAYHEVLVALLVVATFIDYDYYVIPDGITLPGMALGLLGGALAPHARPEPAAAATTWAGLGVGVAGLLAGGALVWGVRIVGGIAFRREAMGFGDVTLLAMIGAFVGWQGAVLAFFLAPFFGLGHALWRLVVIVGRRLRGVQSRPAEHEIPFGPYLSMAALVLLLGWPWIWSGWARGLFATLGEVVAFLLGRGP